MPVPAFADVGKSAREILTGTRDGVFQFDQKVTLTSKTADGVALTLVGVNKGSKTDLSLRTVYNYKNYGINALFNASDKVTVVAHVDNVAPGLRAALSATLPDAQSGKLAVDYVNPYLNVKTTVGLTTSPKVTVAASSGVKNLVYGVEGSFDTAKSTLSAYNLALGYNAGDSQLAAQLTDKLETLKLAVAHNITRDKSIAAEITRPVKGGDVAVTLGILRRLDNGALVKAKIDQAGLLSALYEQKLAGGEKLVVSTQFDTLNTSNAAPKVGFALELA